MCNYLTLVKRRQPFVQICLPPVHKQLFSDKNCHIFLLKITFLPRTTSPNDLNGRLNMKHCIRVALCSSAIFMLLMIGAPGFGAENPEAPLVPLPSVFDFTRGTGWGLALGVGVEYGNSYDGSDEYEFEIEPAGAVQYRIDNHLFFWEGMEAGWRGLLANSWLLQLNARYESGREADDSDDGQLDGLQDQDDDIVGVIEFRRALGQQWRGWVGGRIMAGESSFGVLGVLAAGYRLGSRLDGTGTEFLLFSTFGSSEFINKDFGVSTEESTNSGLPATDLDGGYRSVGLNIIDRRYITEHIQIIAQGGIELYSSDIQDSPIAREDYEIEVGLAVVYQF
jgi:outer membrane scaffolding protein for murein synthesis (MipA/OmpV family)